MTVQDKIKAIVEARLASMTLEDLERYFIDTETFEYETYSSDSEIDQTYTTYVEAK